MKKYHVKVMSIDPNNKDSNEIFNLTIKANNGSDAEEKGKEEFKNQYPALPIFRVKVFVD